METIFCKNRDEWRAWLEHNHALSKEIWLIYYKKHTKKETVMYNEAVEEALCFGWIDSTVKRIDNETYMQKYTPRKNNSLWSLVNTKRIEKLIQENKMTEAGMKKVKLAKENGRWEKAYTSQSKIEIPDYLEKALKSSKIAWTNFNKFANSYQNLYVGWVISAKRKETREKRISVMIERCEKNLKPGIM